MSRVVSAQDPQDEAAWFRAEYPALRRFAAVSAPPEMDPDDLVQEALARVLSARSLLELDDPGAYLRRTITNLAANERRRLSRRRKALRLVEVENDPEPPAYPSDVEAVLQLAPSARAVLYLAEVEKRSFKEIGALLGMTEQTARKRASRGRRRLRDLLGEEYDG